jgi:hypothetical protein
MPIGQSFGDLWGIFRFIEYRNEITTIDEKGVINKLRDLLTKEEAKKLKGDHFFDKEDIDRWKILINYDFNKLTSYPSKFGANVQWSEWNELYQRGLICEEEVKDIIKQKAEELARG